ncbi:alpha-(1-_3)-arabinofuranosyltransferase domain-containing protein [Nocardioides jensenii]|uniref:alpha-(1->3)-arabinofuranosyltransferase domain-containing protein n=1 Tax=Nocardioides jensenii TaxID=1843 RepID=UPI000835DA0F|nr:alpha-(1->3)-arabinofuranosyltransferase family protein [Nocardioides jensenii]
MNEGDHASATTPLRRSIYALVLVLFAFIQRPGLLVADTKFDLVVSPGRFLTRATSMWDGGAAFGQIQNQAYGYFFPMGPFFWIGEQLGLEPWVTQRLWWSLLLVLAFFGLLKVAETLGVGKPWTRVVAAFAYALSVHITTIIGASSVEAWPTALVPWVLWAVMRGTHSGSERRWAAAAGLLTAACGGVNAVAVAAVLPLGACWIFTREGGRRRWVFFAWWVGCTLLATLWWLVPLFLMGSYSFPFLDYIENATVTTLPTDLPDVVGGSSVWVPYIDSGTYGAGHGLGMTPFLIVDAALLAGLGLAGLARKDTPHRQFLLVSLLVGVALLSFGYTGDGAGWLAGSRQELLDGALAPLRNLHKFDAVLRLPLVLGLAHVLAVMMPSWKRATWSVRLWPGVAVLALVGTASPWFIPSVAPAGATEAVPDYWVKAADYLNTDDVGGQHGRTLVVPAAAFGTYDWGSPRDDVLQPLMTAAWGVRNVVPLAEPGNVAFLDAVTAEVESGAPSPRLAAILSSNGVSRLVVRNDLNRGLSGAPDPVILHQALERSPGLRPVASFGPSLGWKPSADVEGGRVLPNGGLSDTYAAVEVYEVGDAVGAVSVVDDTAVPEVAGAAGAGFDTTLVPGNFVLAGDDSSDHDRDFVLTDTLRKREKAFASVRRNESSTMSSDDAWRLSGREHFHRMRPDEERWMGTTVWDGVRQVTASSSQAWADSAPPIDRGSDPGAALDGDPESAWRTAPGRSSVGQWWQVDFDSGTDLDDVVLTVPEDTFVSRVRLSNGTAYVDVDLEDAGEPQHVTTTLGQSDSLRISVLEVAKGADYRSFELAEVEVPGVVAQRYLALPEPPADADLSGISLNRDRGTSACSATSESLVCQDVWATRGEDGDVIARRFDLPTSSTQEIALRGSLRSGPAAVEEVSASLPFEVGASSSGSTDLRGSVLATLDDDDRSTWVADTDDEDPALKIVWPRPQRISRIGLVTDASAPGARPTKVAVTAGGRTREVDLDADGNGRFPAVTTRRLTIEVLETAPVYSGVVDPAARMPVGVSELVVKASPAGPNLLQTADRTLRLPCGEGPGLQVNGAHVDTSVTSTLTDLLNGRMDVVACSPTVSLDAGENSLLTEPTAAVRIDHVDLTVPEGDSSSSAGADEAVPVTAWSDHERTLQLGPGDGRRILVVAENFSSGWEARIGGQLLEPQRVSGWKQGWVVPEGASGEVQLTFAPQSWFVGGLVAGALGLVLLLGLALVPARRGERPATSREASRPTIWFVLVPAAGLLAGWAGFAIAVVGLLTGAVARRRFPTTEASTSGPGILAAVLVVGAGLWTAWDRSRAETLTSSWVGQLLVLGAFVVAVFGAFANGPESLKRSIGRSTR